MATSTRGTLRRPFFEIFLGLESCLAAGGRSLVTVFAGLLLGSWYLASLVASSLGQAALENPEEA